MRSQQRGDASERRPERAKTVKELRTDRSEGKMETTGALKTRGWTDVHSGFHASSSSPMAAMILIRAGTSVLAFSTSRSFSSGRTR